MKPSMKCCAILLLFAGLLPLVSRAQLNNGGLYAGFGVDADTRANYMKYGVVTGAIASDDWFAPSGFGNNVIDTSNAATYLSLLQTGTNYTFSKRMSQLLYAKIGGKLWLDAAYGRDYSAAANLKDSTVFTMAAKNGDNPNIWTGGVSSVPTKNDLVDVYAHMRRDGTTAYDSLWFFTGIAAYGNAASSYYDVELYKSGLSYSSTTGTFTSGGTAGGHSEWLFDAAGNVIQTGDMIVAVTFAPGSPPTIDVRLWVSQGTFNSYYGGALAPKYFDFNGTYSTSGSYGYASIVSKAGTTAFGGGISNYSATPANDTTYATPWGTSNNASGWSASYQSTQFIEVGLNLTRIGVDPALYPALNPCSAFYSNIFFASRSSASFTADLKDFVIPLTFLRPPVLDFTAKTDTLRCNHTMATLTLTNNTTAGYYTWKTLGGGDITAANGDSSRLRVSKPGSYIVTASPAAGCPATRVDTLVVPIDTFPPVASATVGLSGGSLDLYGGDTAASNYSTPFGGSQGLFFTWAGPGGFSSTAQDPVTDTVWGVYTNTVTEKRNGCKATASTNVVAALFTALLDHSLVLEGAAHAQQIDLAWQDLDRRLDLSFVVQRGDGVLAFEDITTVLNPYVGGGDEPGRFAYTDAHPREGNNFYRVKALTADGLTYYSPTITVYDDGISPAIFLGTAGLDRYVLFVKTQHSGKGVIMEYNVNGQVLTKEEVALEQGMNTLAIPAADQHSVNVVALFMDGRIVWCQKVVF
jgi:hypothetical protein